MITEEVWDSVFFQRKIGKLKIDTKSLSHIEAALDEAKVNGFQYIKCKIPSFQSTFTRHLESLNFYLSDIAVSWTIETNQFLFNSKTAEMRKSIKEATAKDIPKLKETANSLFLESYYYNDPFYSKNEADNFYETWIENSVINHMADIMLFIPNKGFISCKKNTKDKGKIVLIGVKKEFRGQSIGQSLIEEAMSWFKSQGIKNVSVRTQLANLNAMNFYLKSGYYIEGYDLVFAKIL